jgi:hypothetical protein
MSETPYNLAFLEWEICASRMQVFCAYGGSEGYLGEENHGVAEKICDYLGRIEMLIGIV